MKIGPAVRPGRVPEKKKDRTGQDSQKKKSQSGNISRIWGEAPNVPIRTKICLVGSLPNVIMHAKFRVETFRGYYFTGGRISHFPIDLRMGLVQRDCAACDITLVN